MLSNTKNVKLGVCKIFFDGVDLGYTKGGVEVSVSTDTHKVEIDQFGKTSINEYIMGRNCKVKVPLAETTLENMVKVMPGATLIDNGVAQVNTLDIVAANSTPYTVTVQGVQYSYTSDADATEGEIALGLVAVINADANCPMAASTSANAASITATVVLTAKIKGEAITVAVGTNLTNTPTTAATAGAKRVDVSTGVGTDLLAIAKQLRLHPQGKADDDHSDDFIVHKAGTAGALQFAYQLEQERVFNVEFTGYPDVTNGNKLFSVGDPAAA